MSQPDKFNEKVQQLLCLFERLYPKQANELAKAKHILSMAMATNASLPATVVYQRLEQPINSSEGRTLLEEIQAMPDVTQIELEKTRIWGCIPYMDKIDKQVWTETSKANKRRIWAYIRELVLLCGHSLEPKVVTDPIELRAVQFNQEYDTLLLNMLVLCPTNHPEDGMRILSRFRAARIQYEQTPSRVCLTQFREAIMPHIASLLMTPDELLLNTPELYHKLPYICELPLDTFWQETVRGNPNNQDKLLEKMIGLIQSCVGLNFLGAEAIQKLSATTERHMQSLAPGDEQNIQQAAMSMLSELQSNNTLQTLCGAATNNFGSLDKEMIRQFAMNALPSEFQATAKGFISGSMGESPFGKPNP